jgi:hypothetical protein
MDSSANIAVIDSKIINENCVAADLEIDNKNCVTTDSEIGDVNCVAADLEIDSDGGVISDFASFFIGCLHVIIQKYTRNWMARRAYLKLLSVTTFIPCCCRQLRARKDLQRL